jgi:hypothetical protein
MHALLIGEVFGHASTDAAGMVRNIPYFFNIQAKDLFEGN